MTPDREQGGQFVSQVTDDELWSLYEELGTTNKVSKACGLAPRSVRERLARIRLDRGITVKGVNIDVAGAMERLVNAVPRSLDGGGRLAEVDTSLWEMGASDPLTGEINKRGLDKIGAKYKFDDKGAIDVLPRESKIVAYRATGITSPTDERIFIVGDCQLGFWAVLSTKDPQKITFEPFHDERAIDVMMQALALYRPDRLVIVGDFVDYAQLSRFQQEPQWAQTMQATIQEAYDLLCKFRKTAGPDCKIDFVPGNHETRMQRAIVNNNPALMNLTRPGEKYPIYSIPSLLKFGELNVECAAEYPSGEVWLAKRKKQIPGLVVTHADPKRKDMRADSIHGHLVLPSIEMHQAFYEDGPVTYRRMCVSGCGNYSDTGDRLRLTRTNTPSGRSRMSAVQSFGTVAIDKATGMREYGLHIITDGAARFMGKILRAA
jgi:Calcineurin-like phosphoesterase